MPDGVIDKGGIGPDCLGQFSSGNTLLYGQSEDIHDFLCISTQNMGPEDFIRLWMSQDLDRCHILTQSLI
jgi:hypothetical protein